MNKYIGGDKITYIPEQGPVVDVVLTVDTFYVLRSNGHNFLRPIAWVDANFKLVEASE